jgi:hypothetical protein
MTPTKKAASSRSADDELPTVTVTHPDSEVSVETQNPAAYQHAGWDTPAAEPTENTN